MRPKVDFGRYINQNNIELSKMIQAFGIKVNETRATQGNISKASFQFVFLKLHKMNKSFKKKEIEYGNTITIEL